MIFLCVVSIKLLCIGHYFTFSQSNEMLRNNSYQCLCCIPGFLQYRGRTGQGRGGGGPAGLRSAARWRGRSGPACPGTRTTRNCLALPARPALPPRPRSAPGCDGRHRPGLQGGAGRGRWCCRGRPPPRQRTAWRPGPACRRGQ